MSYCRWSCDSFRCDIYAYEAHGGWTIHVAVRKREIPAGMNDPLAEWIDGGGIDLDAAIPGHQAFMAGLRFPDHVLAAIDDEIAAQGRLT